MPLPMARTTTSAQLRSRAFLIYRGAVTADSPVQCVADVHAVLGEGPVWVAREAALYWVDIAGKKIFRLDSAGNLSEWATPLRVGSIVPRASGGVISGTHQGIAAIDLETNKIEVLLNPQQQISGKPFHDGQADPRGP